MMHLLHPSRKCTAWGYIAYVHERVHSISTGHTISQLLPNLQMVSAATPINDIATVPLPPALTYTSNDITDQHI